MELKCIVFGEYGTGKTTLLGSSANDERTFPGLLLDFEGGAEVAIESKVVAIPKEDFGKVDNLELGQIHSIRIKTWDDLEYVLDKFYEAEYSEEGLPYKFLGVDSLSEINYLNLRYCVDNAIQIKPRKNPEMYEIGDYGSSGNMMRRLVREFRDLPIHVVFSALPQEETDTLTAKKTVRPNLVGKLTGEIPGLVHVVGYLAVETGTDDKPERVIYFQPDGRLAVKDNTEGGKLGNEIVEPTISKMMDLALAKKETN